METVRPTRNVKLLLGFLVKAEVDVLFRQNLFGIPQIDADPIRLWRQSSNAVAGLPPTPALGEVRILEDGETPVVAEIRARRTFKKHYESFADYQFAIVPVDLLLTPQCFADLDYIRELAGQIGPNAGLEQQIRFAMAEGAITEPIVAGAQAIFTSQRRDLHVEQIPSVRDVGGGEFEIVTRACSRPNYVQAVEVDGRLLLTNGVHKVCAMTLRGHTHVPCLLRRVNRVEESGLNIQQTSLLRPDLLGGPRPAQVIDFLNDAVAVPVTLRSMYQVLRVGIAVEMFDVPAIPPSSGATRRMDDDLEGVSLVPKVSGVQTSASSQSST